MLCNVSKKEKKRKRPASENANMHQPRTVLSSSLRPSTDCLSDYRDTLLPTVQGTQCPTSILSHCLRTESSSCVCVRVRQRKQTVCSKETSPRDFTGRQRCLSLPSPNCSLSLFICLHLFLSLWEMLTQWNKVKGVG